MDDFIYSYPTKVYFGKDAAKKAVTAELGRFGKTVMLENLIKECGLPTKMGQLESTVEITPEVLRQAADTCSIIKCNPRELDREEIYQILMECM